MSSSLNTPPKPSTPSTSRSSIKGKEIAEDSPKTTLNIDAYWRNVSQNIEEAVGLLNSKNFEFISSKLADQDLVSGLGLFCKYIIRKIEDKSTVLNAAALVAKMNGENPEVGKLTLGRVIVVIQNRFLDNIDDQLGIYLTFIGHLVNFHVAHVNIAFDLIDFLVRDATQARFRFAATLFFECAHTLFKCDPGRYDVTFKQFKDITPGRASESLRNRVLAIKKTDLKNRVALWPEDQIPEHQDYLMHKVSLWDEIDVRTDLDILGPDVEVNLGPDVEVSNEEKKFQRWVRVRIVSCYDFGNAADMLLKIRPGQEVDLCKAVLKSCIEEKNYRKFYGLLGQRMCMLNKSYQRSFEKCFVDKYSVIHTLETNKLTNLAKFFADLFGKDVLSLQALPSTRLSEGGTTSRCFIKILFQELLNIVRENESISVPPDCSLNLVAINQYFYYATQIPGLSENIGMVGKISCGLAYVAGILYEVSRPCALMDWSLLRDLSSLKDWWSVSDWSARNVIAGVVYTLCGVGIAGCVVAFILGEMKK